VLNASKILVIFCLKLILFNAKNVNILLLIGMMSYGKTANILAPPLARSSSHPWSAKNFWKN